MRLSFLLASAMFFIGAAAATAKDPVYVTSTAVGNKPTLSADPAKGYALLRTTMPTELYVIRVPDAADLKAYNDARAAALAEERVKYPRRMKSYERDVAIYERSHGTNPAITMPEKPIEPTEENFEYPAFETLAGATLGGGGRFAKGEKGYSVYLQELTPGAYRIYGSGALLLGFGHCFCMGSVKFDVKAGEVVDLGTLNAPDGLVPFRNGMAVDPRLSQWTVKPATFKPVGKLPNYFGVNVTRIQPIESVIAYDRDKILDATKPQPSS